MSDLINIKDFAKQLRARYPGTIFRGHVISVTAGTDALIKGLRIERIAYQINQGSGQITLIDKAEADRVTAYFDALYEQRKGGVNDGRCDKQDTKKIAELEARYVELDDRVKELSAKIDKLVAVISGGDE